MKKGFWIVGFVLLFIACNNNADGNATADSTTADGEVVDEVDLQESFPDLFAYLKKQDGSLSIEKFNITEAATINTQAASPLDEEIETFAPYLVYNENKSLAIDLYSYNHFEREKEGNTVLEMASPDTEVALVNFDQNTRQRIFFTGPSVSLLDARWTAPKEILLAGAEHIDDDKVKPLLWKINLTDSSMISFAYTDTLQAKVYDYVEQKFKAN